MTKISHVEKLVKKGSVPVHFIVCKYPDDRDCYYFIICSNDNLKKIQEISDGEFDLNDYGKIIASGWGKEPSEEVKAMLKKDYGVEV